MSFGEIFVIMLFILLFFGSESIPTMARTLGRTMRQIRDAGGELQQEIKKSADKMIEESGIKSLKEEGVDEIEKTVRRLDQQMDED